ncbi:hypothetical protein NA57DRAFT_52081 [Rhizodiscina lignyota]|uniref:Uncharacterized protein n=1 Tax=Rhizodiscina lignyota TaxID=1504668 RepID=A0A9P4IM75_9PEZI|nr:hypothetical protein NA57DRAFT_52081 [Rhizodiscina lignyota]
MGLTWYALRKKAGAPCCELAIPSNNDESHPESTSHSPDWRPAFVHAACALPEQPTSSGAARGRGGAAANVLNSVALHPSSRLRSASLSIPPSTRPTGLADHPIGTAPANRSALALTLWHRTLKFHDAVILQHRGIIATTCPQGQSLDRAIMHDACSRPASSYTASASEAWQRPNLYRYPLSLAVLFASAKRCPLAHTAGRLWLGLSIAKRRSGWMTRQRRKHGTFGMDDTHQP